jgi:RIO kinase 2
MGISADHIRKLHKYEIRILVALERLMKRYQWVPLDILTRTVKLSESEMEYRIGRLMEWGMVRYDTVPYEGYTLVFSGYDTIALITLTRKGTVNALGCMIGEGKEALVYEGLGLGPLALKFHHVGQRSFQSARVTREYLPEQGHCPWIFASAYSAEREYQALQRLQTEVSVPLPIDHNRHVVAMELISGVTLNRCRLSNPRKVLDEILENTRKSYELGIIHSDLSEFNVMADEGEHIYLIDWPQWIDPAHPNAEEILSRDVDNILRYFDRKYRVSFSLNDAMALVMQ